MRNRVINIIKSFNENEVQQFNLFLNSPFFNKSEKIKKLFLEIKKYYPEFTDENLNYQKLHNAVSPDLKFNEITMRRLLFDLEKLALSFLKYSGLQEDDMTGNNLLRLKLEQKSLNSHYIDNIKKSEALTSEGVFDEKYFLNKLDLETDKFNFNYVNKRITGKKDIDTLIISLISGSNYLFLYYIMRIVKHYLSLQSLGISYKESEQEKNLAQFLKTFFDNLDPDYLKEFLKDESKDYFPIYEIYHNLFLAFSNSKWEGYNKLKSNLLKNIESFSFSEKNFLFGSLIDFCHINIHYNRDRSRSIKELLSLYDRMLSKRYYMSETSPYLPEILYRSILKFSLEAKKFKWAEKFIKVYSDKLHGSNIQDLKNYGYARLYMAKMNFAQALSYLYRTNFSSFNIKLEIKNMTLFAHYELGNYDMLKTEMLSYKSFIKNNKVLSKENKARYKNYIFYLDKYVKFINNRNKSYIDSLKQKLHGESNIIYKEWLLEKANQLAAVYRRTA